MAHFSPKLSDEEDDMLELDELAFGELELVLMEDDLDLKHDLHKIIEKYLTPDEQAVIIAKLHGYSNTDLEVTRKYWTYHMSNAIPKLKKHLT
jgi:hypothetical protein